MLGPIKWSPKHSHYSCNERRKLMGGAELEKETAAQPCAVIYLRVSTKDQATKGGEAEGYSIPAQRQACHRKAESLGAAVVGGVLYAGESPRSAHRPQLQAMLAYVATHPAAYVIVHK